MKAEHPSPPCPMCEYDVNDPLGEFDSSPTWYRCRACGIVYKEADPPTPPATAPKETRQ